MTGLKGDFSSVPLTTSLFRFSEVGREAVFAVGEDEGDTEGGGTSPAAKLEITVNQQHHANYSKALPMCENEKKKNYKRSEANRHL